MYEPGRTQVRCPWCREAIPVEPISVVTFTGSDEAAERFLSGEYDQFPCPTCQRSVPWSNPVVAHDVTSEIVIYYFPDPPDEALREEIEAGLVEDPDGRGLGFEGVPLPPAADWKVRVAFGREELRAMIENGFKDEGCP